MIGKKIHSQNIKVGQLVSEQSSQHNESLEKSKTKLLMNARSRIKLITTPQGIHSAHSIEPAKCYGLCWVITVGLYIKYIHVNSTLYVHSLPCKVFSVIEFAGVRQKVNRQSE